MYLDKPALPVSFTLEEAVKLIEKTIRDEKNWSDFKAGDLKLVYRPYWTCYYDFYHEKDGKVEKLGSGVIALSSYKNELSDRVTELLAEDHELEQETAHKYPIEFQESRIKESEARSILTVKLSSKLKVQKSNIILSAVQLIYAPIWVSFVTIAEKNYKLEIDAVTGKLLNEEIVPEREKGWLELTAETMAELSEPNAWIKYTKDVGETVSTGFIKSLSTGKKLWIIVIVLTLIAAAVVLLGF